MRKLVFALLLAATAATCGCEKIVKRNAEADQLLDNVLQMFAAGEGMKVYDDLGAAELKAQVSREKWQEVSRKLEQLGKPKESNRTSFHIGTKNGVTTGEYKYTVTWEKGKGTFTLKTKVEDDNWTVLGVNYEAKGQ